MVCKVCPARKTCFDKGNCETCDFGKAFKNFINKIEKLKAKNEKLQSEKDELEDRIDTLLNPNF